MKELIRVEQNTTTHIMNEQKGLPVFTEERQKKARYTCAPLVARQLIPEIVIVIVNSKLLKRHSKAKRRAPAYSRALRQIRGVFQRIVRGKLRFGCQKVRRGRLGVKAGVV